MKYFLGVVLLFCCATFGFAQTPEQLFEAGNKAYNSQSYQDAIEQYETLLEQEYVSSDLHTNLGNAYFKTNQVGLSIYHLNKALQLNPNNQSAQQNLDFIQSSLPDEVSIIEPFILWKWWKSISQLWSSTIWAILSILAFFGFGYGLIQWVLAAERSQKKKGFFLGLAALLVGLILLGLGNTKLYLEHPTDQAIVLHTTIELRIAPDQESTAVRTIYEGTKVFIEDSIEDWNNVTLTNGEQGWLPKGCMKTF